MNVTFLRVTDNKTKIQRILNTIHQHFLSHDKVIIFTPNAKASAYLDGLLWDNPKNSFLPHSVADAAADERVLITESDKNIIEASVAINLTSAMCPEFATFDKVYELWDETDPKKTQESQAKKQQYSKFN